MSYTSLSKRISSLSLSGTTKTAGPPPPPPPGDRGKRSRGWARMCFAVMYQHVSPPTVNNTQQANELEHLGLMVFANPFVIFFFFFFAPLSLSPLLSFSLSHATDVFLCRSNRQESTGKKKSSIFPRREEYKAPQSAYSRCREPVHLPPARAATWA